MKKTFLTKVAVICMMTAVTFTGCNKKSVSDENPTTTITQQAESELVFDHSADIKYAREFTLDYYKDGYKMFTIEKNHPGQKFLIVPEGKEVPTNLDENTVVLQQPLNKITFNSTGAVSLVAAINGLDNVNGVGTDMDGWYIDAVKERMEAKKISFTGKYNAPDFEQMTASQTQMVVETTMVNSNADIVEKYKELNIPLIVENSSKEATPLGRVEWVKLYAALMNMEEEADAYFNKQEEIIGQIAKGEMTGKTVAMFYTSAKEDKNYVRNAGDYMAEMIQIAGGEYVFADLNPDQGGTTAINSEELYAKCSEADYIIYINFAKPYGSIQDMIDSNDMYQDYKAVKEKQVFITSPDFTQSIAGIATIIEDMHKVLLDPTDQTITKLIRLQ